MAEDENIYYIQKQENSEHISLDTTDCVWQDAYTEVVAYEENVEDSSLNITYVTEGNESSNENYETAGEDSSQYYSVIETNDSLDHDQTLQPIESHSELDLNEDFKGNLTVIQYPAENVDSNIKTELIDETKVENVENTIIEDDDQVILYKIEDSNELFAVQIARDADGNIQKYQYKVRQNEDGQLEAVPGTIQIQPEGTEQLICEDSITNKDITLNQNTEEVNDENYQTVYENSESEEIKTEIIEEATNESVKKDNYIQSEEVYETNDIEVENQYEDEIVEKLDEENSHIEYLKQDEAEVLQHTSGETYYEETEEEEEFENIEYLQDDDDEDIIQYEQLEENYIEEPSEQIQPDIKEEPTYIKQYPPNSQVEVLSNVLMESNSNINNTLKNNITEQQHLPPSNSVNTPKQILNKLSDITFGNESIELKRVNSGATSKQANKLTFLIVTHPEEKQNIPKHFVNNKKFRSILRPSIHQQSAQQKSTNYSPVFKVNCSKPVKHKVDVPISKSINTVLNITPNFNKGPRQPRKQVITPVDRVGSEIIIQAPEEKDLPVETYDLDAFSDEEYSPRMKPKLKKVSQAKQKRGKKSIKSPDIVITDISYKSTADEGDTENNDFENTAIKNNPSKKKEKIDKPVKEVVEVKKIEKPKFDKVLPVRKRGRPGRPKLSEKNKVNMIEKEVISSGSIKGGQSGRPKFIRTTRKVSNGKQKVEPKEIEEKPIKIEKIEIIEEVEENDGLSTPKRRGRPPKKYTPDYSETKKRKNSSDDNQSIKTESDKYFGFCSDSEIEEKDVSDPPVSKKQKTESESEKNDIVDDLMSEMQDIHGVSDEEHIKVDEVLVENEKTETETLLSILETSPNEKQEKEEDVLTRALKSANIITPSDVTDDNAKQKSELETPSTFLETDNESINKLKKTSIENENEQLIKSNKIETEPSRKPPIYKCAKCAKTFVKYLSLKSHLQEHNLQKKGKFNCNKCSRIFTLESALKFHEKTTHFKSETNINIKMNSDHSVFKCIHCSKSFKTLLQLKTHKISHKTFKCDKCSKIFNTRSEHINHIRRSHHHTTTTTTEEKEEEEDVVKTRTLRRSTQDKREFSEIIQTISKIEKSKRKTISKNTNDQVIIPDTHRCKVCMKTFRQLAHLVMHREVHNKPTCTNCGQVFRFKHALSEHMRRYCLKSPISNNSSKKLSNSFNKRRESFTYNCEKCKKTFKNKMFYNNHMKMYHHHHYHHHTLKSSSSNVIQIKNSLINDDNCIKTEEKTVKDNNNRNNTVVSAATISDRRQSDRKQVPTQKVMPIRCEMCDLSFTTYTGLFRHTLSHPDIKEKCEHCDAGFETKTQLLKHLHTHVNIECRVCKKTFKTNDQLSKHNNESGHGGKMNNEQGDKSVLLTMKKSVNITKKNLAHGGIPLSLKLKNKLLKRKL